MTAEQKNRTVWESRPDRDGDARLVDRLTESPARRRERIANKIVDADAVAALRRLWS